MIYAGNYDFRAKFRRNIKHTRHFDMSRHRRPMWWSRELRVSMSEPVN